MDTNTQTRAGKLGCKNLGFLGFLKKPKKTWKVQNLGFLGFLFSLVSLLFHCFHSHSLWVVTNIRRKVRKLRTDGQCTHCTVLLSVLCSNPIPIMPYAYVGYSSVARLLLLSWFEIANLTFKNEKPKNL